MHKSLYIYKLVQVSNAWYLVNTMTSTTCGSFLRGTKLEYARTALTLQLVKLGINDPRQLSLSPLLGDELSCVIPDTSWRARQRAGDGR